MERSIKKADILIEALPYIKKFRNKVFVIKYGGSILGNEKIRKSVLDDLIFLSFVGIKIVLVHGGGPNITQRLEKKGKKNLFHNGERITDKDTLKIVTDELKKLNNKIVRELSRHGVKIEGLSGSAKNLIAAKKKDSDVDLGFVGEIKSVNSKLLKDLLKKDGIVVVSPLAKGKGKIVYNINADTAAQKIASGLNAEKLVMLTNVKGITTNAAASGNLIPSLTIKEANKLIGGKIIKGGMIPKVQASIGALKSGVNKTHIIDAKLSHALLLEIFTDEGIGTEIV